MVLIYLEQSGDNKVQGGAIQVIINIFPFVTPQNFHNNLKSDVKTINIRQKYHNSSCNLNRGFCASARTKMVWSISTIRTPCILYCM